MDPSLRLNVGLERGPERRFRFAALERYRRVPVLVRQTANRPIAALHDRPTFFRNSVLACTPPAELDPAFVVAVLNSTVACRWHRARHRDARQRSFPQVKVGHLRALPFPMRSRTEGRALHDAIARRVRELGTEGVPDARAVQAIDRLVAEAYGVEG